MGSKWNWDMGRDKEAHIQEITDRNNDACAQRKSDRDKDAHTEGQWVRRGVGWGIFHSIRLSIKW